MKTTGLIRQLDSLGRIVLPIELRRTLDIHTKDMLEICVEGNAVILRKYEPNCYFCGGNHGLVSFKEKQVCRHCLKDLKEL
ncbi:MAG: AbrB/MazE/SpoVT family DNA-binding domain-containing protein [Clostridia bacterium]|nr:AbrB/MazE/SpoVT family DNA-binding domain-containing protein [Clostridia bacterium]